MVFSWGVEIGRCKGTRVLAKSSFNIWNLVNLKSRKIAFTIDKSRGQKKEV
jgi:hypothetical protein